MAAPTRPMLRYHGGKWMLAPWIISHFPKHRIYLEPFGGAASVLLRKPRSYAEIYNDLDGEVVNLFRMVRDRGDELRALLGNTPFSRSEFMDSYAPDCDEMEQARRTIIRSFMGFGSNAHFRATGFRSNSNRIGTIPAHDWANYPSALDAIIERIRGVVIENRDAVQLMYQHDSSETLHYVDPPYLHYTRDAGNDYRHEMTETDHHCMCDCLNLLQGHVVLSGYDNPLYNAALDGWKKVYRRSFADGARERVECLWITPQTVEKMELKL